MFSKSKILTEAFENSRIPLIKSISMLFLIIFDKSEVIKLKKMMLNETTQIDEMLFFITSKYIDVKSLILFISFLFSSIQFFLNDVTNNVKKDAI